MIRIEIPGRPTLEIQVLFFDLNGTLGVDGVVSIQVAEKLRALSATVDVHVITADTFGTADTLSELGVRVVRLLPGDHVAAKSNAIRAVGPDRTIAIGNGMNDSAMLREAAVGILVMGREGAAIQSLLAADVAVTSPEDALDLVLKPKRLIATLRTR